MLRHVKHAKSANGMLRTHHAFFVLGGLALPFLATALVFATALSARAEHRLALEHTSDLEVGVADLSPRGESGGAVVPASCSSGIPGGHEACNVQVWWNPAGPINIPWGGTVSYGWNSSQAYTCDHTVTGIGAGSTNFVGGNISGTWSNITYNTAGTQTHTMTCWDSDRPSGSSATAVLTINVAPEVLLKTLPQGATTGSGYPWGKVVSFGPPATVPLYGSATINWNGLGSCQGEGSFPGWAGPKPNSGSFTAVNPNTYSQINANTPALFQLRCTGSDRSSLSSIYLTFVNEYDPQPPTCPGCNIP